MVENSLSTEVRQLHDRRLELEEGLQQSQQAICNLQVQLRQRESQFEGCIRENRSFIGTFQIAQQAYNELMVENNNLKEQVSESEQQKLVMRSQMEKQNQDFRVNQEMKQQRIDQLESMLNQARIEFQQMQDDHSKALNGLKNQLYFLKQTKEQDSFERQGEEAEEMGGGISWISKNTHY